MTSAQIKKFLRYYALNQSNPNVDALLCERTALWVNDPRMEELRMEVFRRAFGDKR